MTCDCLVVVYNNVTRSSSKIGAHPVARRLVAVHPKAAERTLAAVNAVHMKYWQLDLLVRW